LKTIFNICFPVVQFRNSWRISRH